MARRLGTRDARGDLEGEERDGDRSNVPIFSAQCLQSPDPEIYLDAAKFASATIES